ncbi:unnamed protein product [[Candida] boidinii]|uniref:Unnamed protein product n=1 Tax=Candida boidinii TaxID=5477 RepID=A0A9W6T564_CANBO|nr:unnamed protein product [[Candida] boidinii]
MRNLKLMIHSLILLLIPLASAAGVTSTIKTNYGCVVPTNDFTQGFNVKLFDYPLLADYYLTPSYFYSQYRTLRQTSSATAVRGVPSIYHPLSLSEMTTSSLWNMVFNPNDFLAEFTSYLFAPATGLYEFYFDRIDDGSMAFLGGGAFACCDSDEITVDAVNQQILYATWSVETGPTGDSALIYLAGGISYPLRIVYINMNKEASFSFTMKFNGLDFPVEDYLYVLPPSVTPSECVSSKPELPKTTTSIVCSDCSSKSTTTTISYFTSASTSEPADVIIIEVPPIITRTLTEPCAACTVPYTTTVYDYVTSDTTSIPEQQIIIRTPVSTLTTTVPCSTYRSRGHH